MAYLKAIISEPKEAREYIKNFQGFLEKKITFVELTNGEKIDFKTMTDSEAVYVANQFIYMKSEALKKST